MVLPMLFSNSPHHYWLDYFYWLGRLQAARSGAMTDIKLVLFPLSKCTYCLVAAHMFKISCGCI